MIKAVLLGTGNGKADPQRFAPSNVVWVDGEPVLIDCGNGALLRLREAGIPPGDIKTVLITHLHFDHYSDYPYLMIEPLIGEAAFSRGNLQVYGPPGITRLVRNFELTYDVELDSYAYLEGYERVREVARADVYEIHQGWSMKKGDWTISAGIVDHGIVKIPSFAYRIDSPDGKSIVFSGDTVPCEGIVDIARGADILVHECNFPDEEVETRKKLGFAWQIHSTPSDAGRVAHEAGARTLATNHMVGWNDFSAEHEPYDWPKIAPPLIEKEFGGELIVGKDLLELGT